MDDKKLVAELLMNVRLYDHASVGVMKIAAARITALAEENERLKAVFAAAQDQMDAYDRIKRAGSYSWIGPTLEYDKAAIKTNEAVRAALSEVQR